MDPRDSIVLQDGRDRKLATLSIGGPIAVAWAEQPYGKRHLEALGAWLSRYESKRTRAIYSQAVMAFFCWLELRRGSVLTPNQVRRADAWAFLDDQRKMPADWVAYWRRWNLDKDDRRIMDIVDESPGVTVSDIVQKLGAKESVVHDRLTRLSYSNYLTRTPKAAELRKGLTNIVGVSLVNIRRYHYYPRPAKPNSDSTLAGKMAALSSYWSFLAGTGENTGETPLLVHNVWSDPAKSVQKGAINNRRASRVIHTPDETIFLRMLSQTFRGYGEGASAAAATYWSGQDPGVPERQPTVLELRDRCLLCWVVGLGLRASEASSLRVSSVFGDGLVMILGKGNKQRVVKAPAPCLKSMAELRAALKDWAAHKSRRKQDRSGLLTERAPLFPALGRWGKTSRSDMADHGMTRAAISGAMRALATKAGINEQDMLRVHPHGFRHLGAHLAVGSGVPLQIIQRALGHSSLAVTGIYVEEHDPERVCLRP